MRDKINQTAGGDIVGDHIDGTKIGDTINKSSTSGNSGMTNLRNAAAIIALLAIIGIFTEKISPEIGSIIIVASFGAYTYGKKKDAE